MGDVWTKNTVPAHAPTPDIWIGEVGKEGRLGGRISEGRNWWGCLFLIKEMYICIYVIRHTWIGGVDVVGWREGEHQLSL